jgi:hypothetical protein
VKSDYYIDRVSKSEAAELLLRFHYLKDISKGFKSGYNYGLYKKNDFSPLNIGGIQGVIIFTGLPVPEIAQGAFGLDRTHEQQGLFELSRLCIHPDTQSQEYNITSWFVQRRLKDLEKKQKSGRLSHTLIAIFILAQSIALVTLSIVDYQMQKKISTMQTELSTLVAK